MYAKDRGNSEAAVKKVSLSVAAVHISSVMVATGARECHAVGKMSQEKGKWAWHASPEAPSLCHSSGVARLAVLCTDAPDLARVHGLVVKPRGGRDAAREPVDGHVGQQLVAHEH